MNQMWHLTALSLGKHDLNSVIQGVSMLHSDGITFFWMKTGKTPEEYRSLLSSTDSLIEEALWFEKVQNAVFDRYRCVPVKFGFLKEEPQTLNLKQSVLHKIEMSNALFKKNNEYGLKIWLHDEKGEEKQDVPMEDGYEFMLSKLKAKDRKSTFDQNSSFVKKEINGLIRALVPEYSRFLNTNETPQDEAREIVNLAFLADSGYAAIIQHVRERLTEIEQLGIPIDWKFEGPRSPQSFCTINPGELNDV